jgi:hypothetical protein
VLNDDAASRRFKNANTGADPEFTGGIPVSTLAPPTPKGDLDEKDHR